MKLLLLWAATSSKTTIFYQAKVYFSALFQAMPGAYINSLSDDLSNYTTTSRVTPVYTGLHAVSFHIWKSGRFTCQNLSSYNLMLREYAQRHEIVVTL